MNKRIKELADQVWREILDETSIDGDISTTFSPDEVVAFEQKFAELLIKECIHTLQLKIVRNGNTPENKRSREHIRDLAEHFGVQL